MNADTRRNTVFTAQKKALEIVEKLEECVESGSAMRGLEMGFRALDDELGGLQPGELVVVAGRPGKGKSAFLASTALNIAKRGLRSYVATLEMPAEQQAERIIAQIAQINMLRLKQSAPTMSDISQMTHGINKTGRALEKIILDEEAGISIEKLVARIKRFHAKRPLDLICIDYLQLMSSMDRDLRRQRHLELGAITMGLKNLAKDLGIPCILLAQLSRKARGGARSPETLTTQRLRKYRTGC